MTTRPTAPQLAAALRELLDATVNHEGVLDSTRLTGDVKAKAVAKALDRRIAALLAARAADEAWHAPGAVDRQVAVIPLPLEPHLEKAFQDGFTSELRQHRTKRTTTAEISGLRRLLAAHIATTVSP